MNLPILHAPELEMHDPGVLHSIEAVSRITRLPRHRIAVYCRHGFVAPARDPELGGWYFDDEALRMICELEHLRSAYGMNLNSLRLTQNLLVQVRRLREEVRVANR